MGDALVGQLRDPQGLAGSGLRWSEAGFQPSNIAAMLRALRPLHGCGPDVALERRRLLADVFRLVGGQSFGPHAVVTRFVVEPGARGGGTRRSSAKAAVLPPRLQQTLNFLLDGDSEKQVAQRLNLSPHTVHVYVKKLYRQFEVRSRAELLALLVRR
jgi:DNA-binding NarL/FixJ family response regulator